MSSTMIKAQKVIDLLEAETPLEDVKNSICTDDQSWWRISAKAYDLHIRRAKKQRKEDEKKKNVSCASNTEIDEVLLVNEKLANYALAISALSTKSEIDELTKLSENMPDNEHKVITIIEKSIMCPSIRAMQKKGRFEHFAIFKTFSKLIDAATLSYYRENYISSYLTLVPVIEGIILRWLDYNGNGKKPEFEEIRNFFNNSHKRQPCPANPLFYNIYIKSCNKILKEHLFKPTEKGQSHSNFNRHLAAHLLNDSLFATKENCIRLFLLIDVMTEIYWYEVKCKDPRFYLNSADYSVDMRTYDFLITQSTDLTPEHVLLGDMNPL